MADRTPGIGRMVAVAGAMTVFGLVAPCGVHAEPPPPPPNPHVVAAQDLFDHASTQTERDGGSGSGVSLIGIYAWAAITDTSR
jgi:hypothetical protein